ncbi:MAG TPA: IS1 family transposase [Gaiellaceae bacterium]
MNRLLSEKRRMIVASLVEGNSINATCRMAGVSKNTVLKLLGDLGLVCSIHQDTVMRNLTCERIQIDEIWSFVYAKQKNVPPDTRGQAGDVWTWVAIDADTKLVPTYRIGPRDGREAIEFLDDLEKRLSNRVQLTSDGLPVYVQAVMETFGVEVDYAMLQKVYGSDSSRKPERRYSPAVCLDAIPTPVFGNPDPDHISTSYVERLNLTTRMSVRRYTRLTNAFSKKLENYVAAVSLHFMHYNFVRVHQTLNTTPAVAAGVADKAWKIDDLIVLLSDAENAVPMKRVPYKKRDAA